MPSVLAGDEEADAILRRLSQSPAFDSLRPVQVLHDELNRRRKAALRVLFNRAQYTGPGALGSERFPFDLAQEELRLRIERVREVWQDPTVAGVSMSREVAIVLAEAYAAVAQASEPGEAARLDDAIAWRALQVTAETLDVRRYFATPSEYARLGRNLQIRTALNAAVGGAVDAWVRELVSKVNDYREMIGYIACVEHYRAESFDRDSVESVLDKAAISDIVPLYALRLSPELCGAAVAHCHDAERRKYQQLLSPPDPGTGAGARGPDEWARENGYEGSGVNAARFSVPDSPGERFQALCAWAETHRLLLGAYLDVGAGRVGDTWMVYFGGQYWECDLR